MDNDIKTEEEELSALERVMLDPSAEAVDLSYGLLTRLTSNFSDQIGRGGYGVVYKGMLPNGLCIAVKKMLAGTMNLSEELYLNEITATMRMQHKNIVRMVGYCCETRGKLMNFDGNYVMAEVRERIICLEYVPNGTLHIHTGVSSTLEWGQRFQIVRGICEGLDYMHREAHLLHLDLNPNNILLDTNSMPKIFDFGCSLYIGEEEDVSTSTITGTRGYIAPEMIDTGRISFKSDIYSLGLIIIKLFTGLQWIEGYNAEKALIRWRQKLEEEGVYSSWENKCLQVKRCLELGFSCMDNDPHKRPTEFHIIQVLDEIRRSDHSVSDGNAHLMWQSGDEQPVPQGSERPAIIQGSEWKEARSELLPGDEESGTLKDAQTSTKKQHTPDLLTQLPKEMSLDVVKKMTGGFLPKNIIGKSGTSGFVYKVIISSPQKEEKTEQGIAVKRLCGKDIPKQDFVEAAELLMGLNHDNIVKLVGYCHDDSTKRKVVNCEKGKVAIFDNEPEQLLCYEYMPHGNLRDYVTAGQRQISSRDDWQMRYKMIEGTCQGLHYLHEVCEGRPIIHLKLSLCNVLLDKNNAPRIADTGVSWLIGENDSKNLTLSMKRPFGHMAPEYYRSQGSKLISPTKADIYSLGVMILEIVTGQENNRGTFIKSVKDNWTEVSHIQLMYASTKETDVVGQVKLCIDIGLQCVNHDYEDRPTAGDIILWLKQGHVSVARASLPVFSTKDTHAGNDDSSKMTADVPVTKTKHGKRSIFGMRRQ